MLHCLRQTSREQLGAAPQLKLPNLFAFVLRKEAGRVRSLAVEKIIMVLYKVSRHTLTLLSKRSLSTFFSVFIPSCRLNVNTTTPSRHVSSQRHSRLPIVFLPNTGTLYAVGSAGKNLFFIYEQEFVYLLFCLVGLPEQK